MTRQAIEPDPNQPTDGGLVGAMQPRLDQNRTMPKRAAQAWESQGLPPPKEYQFDLANALLIAAALAIVAFAWFARRRLKWLGAKACAISAQIIRWLHMPPDGKI